MPFPYRYHRSPALAGTEFCPRMDLLNWTFIVYKKLTHKKLRLQAQICVFLPKNLIFLKYRTTILQYLLALLEKLRQPVFKQFSAKRLDKCFENGQNRNGDLKWN